MKDKKKFKIKNLFKSRIFFFVIGALIFGTIGVGATTLLYSKDITYDNSSSGLSSTNLQDALDELYEQAKTGGASVSCDDDYNCTVTCKQGKPTITSSGYTCASTTIVICPNDRSTYFATPTGYRCLKPAGEQLKENIVTNGDGLYVDSTESGRYVYKGANPNNYITFNRNLWRILAVEIDGTIKIIKQDSIGNMAYDSNNTFQWPNASLNTYLNGTYYNTLDNTYIQNHSFNVGDVSWSDSLTTTINEEKAKKWTGNIALATVSDYIKSNANISSCGSISSNNSNYSTCKISSFIAPNGWPWLLSWVASSANRAWYKNANGSVEGYFIYNASYSVFPVLFLKSDITLSGSGTQSDPYTIN